MGIIRENLDFIRGADPKQSMGIGKTQLYKNFGEAMQEEFPNLFLKANWAMPKDIPYFQEKNRILLNIVPKKAERLRLLDWIEINYPKFKVTGIKYEHFDKYNTIGVLRFKFME